MRQVITIILVTLDYIIVLFLFHFESFLHGSTALIKVPVGSKPNNQSLHPFENHPTTNTLNQQTLNITNNNQTQTLHVTNMPPYTKHSKYKPRKPRTALVLFCFCPSEINMKFIVWHLGQRSESLRLIFMTAMFGATFHLVKVTRIGLAESW